MTNQTIDGVLVSRETLQRWLDDIGPSRHVTQYATLKRDELRALLDAPVCSACNDTGRMHEPGCEPGACTACLEKPAAQSQGVPLAWTEVDVLDFMSVALRHAEYSGLAPSDILDGLRYMAEKGKPAFVHADQLAPVAVVMPGPGPDQKVEARAKEIYEGWSYGPGFAPWVDGGNSIMQGKARDLARREVASK